MSSMNVLHFAARKAEKKKISMVTCYDHWSAKLINESEIDCVLVGDSLAMVMHGHASTVPASVELMRPHVEAVVRGAPAKFVIADMPFLSFRKGLEAGMNAVDTLMKAGAQAVKLEGVRGHAELVSAIVDSGVPVMGHLGLTPQSVHGFGGFKVQAKEKDEAERLYDDALELERLGCFAVVLECIPSKLAQRVTEALSIPTIGIGAGSQVDGQVLVLQDMLGFNTGFKPRFLRQYMNGAELVTQALNHYAADVREGSFPSEGESYS